MDDLTHLEGLVLEPVVELEPSSFATQQRPTPAFSGETVPGDWDHYWLDALADAGIVGLKAIRPGSWHVPTRRFTDPEILSKTVRGVLGTAGDINDLVGPDADPVLSGGLALISDGTLILEPACCGDLRTLSDWRAAAGYRGADWQMLWIGHPWVAVKFSDGVLVLSDPHESGVPVGRYAIQPDELVRAIDSAATELEDFSRRLRVVLGPMLGEQAAPGMSHQLAGLAPGE